MNEVRNVFFYRLAFVPHFQPVTMLQWSGFAMRLLIHLMGSGRLLDGVSCSTSPASFSVWVSFLSIGSVNPTLGHWLRRSLFIQSLTRSLDARVTKGMLPDTFLNTHMLALHHSCNVAKADLETLHHPTGTGSLPNLQGTLATLLWHKTHKQGSTKDLHHTTTRVRHRLGPNKQKSKFKNSFF